MAAPFAARMQRINAAVQRHLANAVATHKGGLPFGVVMERGQTSVFGGDGDVVDSAVLTCSFDARNAPGLAEGGELIINGVRHRVGGGVQPDAGGWVVVEVFPFV